MEILDAQIELPVHIKLRNELKKQGRTISWLASELEFCYSHTHSILTGRFTLTEKNRKKINELLGTDY